MFSFLLGSRPAALSKIQESIFPGRPRRCTDRCSTGRSLVWCLGLQQLRNSRFWGVSRGMIFGRALDKSSGLAKCWKFWKTYDIPNFPRNVKRCIQEKDERNRRFRESLRSLKKPLNPLRGHHVSTRRSALQGGHCNTVRSLEGPLFDIDIDIGKLAGGQRNWLKFLLKVDSTLKNLFFFHEKFKFERKKWCNQYEFDKFGSRKDAMEVNLLARYPGKGHARKPNPT